MGKYYDGTKLLSLLDSDKQKPTFYISTSNRSAGKTTFFSRLCVNKFVEKGEQFGVIVRYNYELEDIGKKFFNEIGVLFFKKLTMKSTIKNGYAELELNGVVCGYAISLNASDLIKKNSHLFAKIERILFDEFISETDKYLKNEVDRFLSVLTTVSRGGGKQHRNVPVYMLANISNFFNPYFFQMKIFKYLKKDTKFLRGRGFVFENSLYQDVVDDKKRSGMFKAFEDNQYLTFTMENKTLYDCDNLIGKPDGKKTYFFTFLSDGRKFAVWKCENGLYCDNNVNDNYETIFTSDINHVSVVCIKLDDVIRRTLISMFNLGKIYFKNSDCKVEFMRLLCYN